MSGLKSDELGFLVGKPVNLTDLHDELSDIHGELAEIKAILGKDAVVGIASKSINKLVAGMGGGVASSRSSSRSKQRLNDIVGSQVAHSSIPGSQQQIATAKARAADEKFAAASRVIAATNTPKGRDSKGRFTSQNMPNESVRDSKGRFLPKPGEQSKAEKDSIGSKIKNVGSSITNAIGELGSGNDQADPSVQAMGEIKGVLSPVGRGMGKLFGAGNGVSRGQDRWYRRFFKQNAEKNRADELAHKREQRLLSNIEKKEGPESSSKGGFLAALFLAFMGTLATLLLKGFGTLAKPIQYLGKFFAPLLKVLQGLAHVLGVKKLADKMGSPGAKGAGGTLKTGGKALLKKLPLVGALLSAGFLAKDLADINGNGESKDVKTRLYGSAVGSAAGGIGGALGGGAAGAAMGSVIPGIGTVAGAIVGALIGGIGGQKVGGMLGDKFGEWVNELRAAGVTDKIAYSWNVGMNAMSIMWRDFTNLAGSVWSGMVAGLQSGWNAVTDFSKTVWQGISDSFKTTTDFLQSSWTVTTTLVGGALNTVWAGLGELASQVNEGIKAKTGIDVAKHVDDLKATVSGWASSLKTAFSDFSESVKGKLGEVFGSSYFGNVLNEAQGMVDTSSQPLSTSKEQDANQTAVLNAMLKAGFSRSQAVALTAEVGRENDYNSRNLYGYHKDEANGAINMGMISWQGDRAKRLNAFMEQKGLIKNGKMVQGQASLDAQAEFMKWEIDNNKSYGKTKQAFASNPNADPEEYAKVLGTNYIRWAYGQNKLSSGKAFNWAAHDGKRRGYKNKALSKTNVAIPFKPGYTPPAKSAVTPTTGAVTPAEQAVESNSVEGMMQTLNGFDGMNNVKQAVVTMLKASAEGKAVAHHKAVRGAVVPAVQVSSPAPIADAPKVALPLASNTKDSSAKLDDVSRDVSDRRIAHIVTGAYSSPA